MLCKKGKLNESSILEVTRGPDDVILCDYSFHSHRLEKKKLRKQKEKLIFRGVQFIKQDKCEEKLLT